MSIPIKSEAEIRSMRQSGKILAEVLEEVCNRAKVGVSTFELDQFAENLIRQRGGTPSFKGYHGYPATLCTARNEVIVHGIPKKNEYLEEGDLFTVDCGVIFNGLHTDAARSIGIGKISAEKQKLLDTAKLALEKGIEQAKPGNSLHKISQAIEKVIRDNGFHVVRDLTGHGIGRSLHEKPVIYNFWPGNDGPTIEPGMTFAIEPIFAVGAGKMHTLADNWTIVTADGSPAVQQENTILITKTGNEILTSPN